MMMDKRQFKRRKRKTADPAEAEPLSPTERAELKPTRAPDTRRVAPTQTDQPPPAPRDKAAQPQPEPATTAATAATAAEPGRAAPALSIVDEAWASIRTMPIDPRHLERQRVIAASREDPAHMAFDVLRTRLIQALAERGWRRVAITSPTRDCGKTFTAANLAVSLSRQENCRTVLLDFDMRNPSLHKVFGLPQPGSIGDFLRGSVAVKDHFRRMGQNRLHIGRTLALACNDRGEPYASELLQEPCAIEAIRRMEALLDPTVVLFDMPPALYHDDVIAFRPHIDGVLLVVGGGRTRPGEIRDVQRRLGEDTPLLGVVLNTAEGPTISHYSY